MNSYSKNANPENDQPSNNQKMHHKYKQALLKYNVRSFCLLKLVYKESLSIEGSFRVLTDNELAIEIALNENFSRKNRHGKQSKHTKRSQNILKKFSVELQPQQTGLLVGNSVNSEKSIRSFHLAESAIKKETVDDFLPLLTTPDQIEETSSEMTETIEEEEQQQPFFDLDSESYSTGSTITFKSEQEGRNSQLESYRIPNSTKPTGKEKILLSS